MTQGNQPSDKQQWKSLLVTGGCGFIGSNFVRYWLGQHPESKVVVYDKLTYAGRKENLHDLWDNPALSLVVGDIGDMDLVRRTCQENDVDLIVNFAAETHVDQSILGPLVFTETNVRGTHVSWASACITSAPTKCTATSRTGIRASKPMNLRPVALTQRAKQQPTNWCRRMRLPTVSL